MSIDSLLPQILAKGGSYMEPRGSVRRNNLILSDKAFLSVRCQFGVSTDTIFKKRYPLDLKTKTHFVRRNHQKVRKKITCFTLVNPVLYYETYHFSRQKHISTDEPVILPTKSPCFTLENLILSSQIMRLWNDKKVNRTLVQSFCWSSAYCRAYAQLTKLDLFIYKQIIFCKFTLK